ncbi:MAG TPA: hypothetical protein VGM52_07495 [Herbaspirillum sp.]
MNADNAGNAACIGQTQSMPAAIAVAAATGKIIKRKAAAIDCRVLPDFFEILMVVSPLMPFPLFLAGIWKAESLPIRGINLS